MPNVKTGTENDDHLVGGRANETMHGLGGNDLLFGAGGKDTLYGGAGNDILWGGYDADDLYGGAGADIFKYADYAESLDKPGTRDKIFDFSSEDFIDLSGVKNGGIISMAFVTIEEMAAGQYRVHVVIDPPGNPLTDMAIDVIGVAPQESQFIFGPAV